MKPASSRQYQLVKNIKDWAVELGFDGVGITDTDLSQAEARLFEWLRQDYHGEMDWMTRHGHKRSRPEDLIPGTASVICVRLNYLPATARDADAALDDPETAFVSRYALGRDYHKVLRRRLQQLATKIETAVDDFRYRVFTDSAPVLEKPLAEKAGLGWIGKHTNLINSNSGSWFFLGEIFTNLNLPTDDPSTDHCGSCSRCIEICPTDAIVAPWILDARRCISYLTIEHPGSIPIEFRAAIGNRVYGCDDCQMVCPWNKFATETNETDFEPRHELDTIALTRLFAWQEIEFLEKTEGSAIRRIGYERFLRNIAVALGNAGDSITALEALKTRELDASSIVREHVRWAMDRQAERLREN